MLGKSAELKKILEEIKTIAVVGAKDKEGQAVDRVGRYLLNAGYTLLPVHPKRKDVWGLPTYESIAALPETPDAVVLFRAPEYCPGHAREVLALPGKPRVFWMQLGIKSEEAAKLMAEAGILAVQDLCIMDAHRDLFGAGIGLSL